MGSSRRPVLVRQSVPTIEGAGVKLHRAFGFDGPERFDPFLLLDDFRGDEPSDYIAGFPWHPHRGMETITYLIDGSVEHGDSLGNAGVISPGQVQWMTAGSGIIHQEMPKPGPSGRMGGFQLWANLPAASKMIEPRYRDVREPDVKTAIVKDAVARIVAGELGGVSGPVGDIVIAPVYADVSVPPGGSASLPASPGTTAIVYVFSGSAEFGPRGSSAFASNRTLVLFSDGGFVDVETAAGVRFLFVCGKPLGEPVAWRGPIVMNTEDELRLAFEEFRTGRFIRHRGR